MDTKPLERFATWARQELLTAVEAQATAVLKTDSVARTERAHAVRALEAEINRHGREHVIDKVAYTWFNRIIALRFMDACGYTDTGVVSPAQGQPHGQPEILADAKRGNIDTDVITSSRTADAIIGLLDGTRRSTDAEGEAYALLLTAHCHYWHGPMPFMFEREDNYTELLVPANLLADDAILSRALEVLTEDVCDDVEVIGWLYQFYISERKKEVFAGFSAKGEARKLAGPDEIPAATQLFTPHWIVRYLVENSLGRLWMLNRPSSQLIDQMGYYIAPVDEETDFLKITKPEELTIIDPACGSGHMLTYAFDLLYAIYEEEGYAPSEIPALILANNLYGTEIDPRAGSLAAFALTMKARAKQRTFFNKQVKPNICVIEPISFGPDELNFLVTRGGDCNRENAFWNKFQHANLMGALIQPDQDLIAILRTRVEELSNDGDIFTADTIERAKQVLDQAAFLETRYSVVVANPPYMGGKNMSSKLAELLESSYPLSKSDLMTTFMDRARRLSVPKGYWGMINLPSWMFLPTFEKFRAELLRVDSFESLLHLGRGIFGADFGSVAFVMRNSRHLPGRRATFRRLFEEHVDVRSVRVIRELFVDRNYGKHVVDQSEFEQLPGMPIAYWLSEEFLASFSRFPALARVATPKQGLATADDQRFLRFWHEVSESQTSLGCTNRETASQTSRRWFPFNKGGAFRRWYGNIEHVVNWENDGQELRSVVGPNGRVRARAQNMDFYFLPSVSWSNVSSSAPAFRWVDEGVIFGHVGQSLFGSESARIASIAVLNSTVGARFLEVLAPTIHFDVGAISKVPVDLELASETTPIVNELIGISRRDWNSREVSISFEGPTWLRSDGPVTLREQLEQDFSMWEDSTELVQTLETRLNEIVSVRYGLEGEIETNVPRERISLHNNMWFRLDRPLKRHEALEQHLRSSTFDMVSYAVGCMFGRYSLDEPGLILADQGATLQDYLAKVPNPTFAPDKDNVIPIVDGDWFEDDIVARFRQFLRAAFGEEHFEANLRFVEESLKVKTLRDYFITKTGRSKFYDDHVQRYKKRPIYWMFSSPKGSFNALIYMHRYTPSTVSTVLNEYLREYRGKLEIALQNVEREAAGSGSSKAQKEADRIRKVLVELAEYEHDVLYPLATQQIVIDLDDGVKVNYPKFGTALKKITGLEAKE